MFSSCFGNDLIPVIYIRGLSIGFNVSSVPVFEETKPPKKEKAKEKFQKYWKKSCNQ